MASQLALKSRIASTGSLEKIFNAQEMIAASHIAQAREVALNAKPYTDAIFDAVQTLVSHSHIAHPIVRKEGDNPRVAVLALTADRGMAGAYTSSIIRETEDLLNRLEGAGKEPELFVYGRRGVSYYKYRNRPMAQTWEGDTEKPGVEGPAQPRRASDRAAQAAAVLAVLDGAGGRFGVGRHQRQARRPGDHVMPLYSFEPSLDEVLDAVLPRYVRSRIHECLLEAAASEVACRQNAMHTATENARDLINDLTRKLNASRQASITQELTEIIAGSQALNG